MQCIVLKWLLVGRVKADSRQKLDSWLIARHWFLKAMCFSAENAFVSKWLISTFGMNCYLKLLGSKCSATARISTIELAGPIYDLVEFGRHSFSAGGPYIVTRRVKPHSEPPVVEWYRNRVGDNGFLGHWCILMQGAGLEGNCGNQRCDEGS